MMAAPSPGYNKNAALTFMAEDEYSAAVNKRDSLCIKCILDALDGIQSLYNKQSNLAFPGANLYPHDLTKEEFEEASNTNGFLRALTTVVVRQGSALQGVPYHVAYKDSLEAICQALTRACSVMPEGRFREYLLLRSEELLNDDFSRGDCLWLDLDVSDSSIDLIIGPFETYIDRFMGLKAAYEGTLSIRDRVTQDKLSVLLGFRSLFEENVPGSNEYIKGAVFPSRLDVTNVIAFSGHSASHKMNAKVLPNDEAIIEKKGTKKILFKNIVEQRIDNIIAPIVKRTFSASPSMQNLKDGMFTFLILHEMAHSAGTRPNPPRLDDLTAGIEEAKAHVLALHFANLLKHKGVLSEDQLLSILKAFVGYLIADLRLGKALRTKAPYRDAAIIIFANLTHNGVLRINCHEKCVVDIMDVEKIPLAAEKVLQMRNYMEYAQCAEQVRGYKKEVLWDDMLGELHDLPVNI